MLVGKGLLGPRLLPPDRLGLAVFQYPPAEQAQKPIHYLKRLVGLPGETVALHEGDLYTFSELKYEDRPRPDQPDRLRDPEFMYESDGAALLLFQDGKFQIVRKPPDLMLAFRRLVYDNDHHHPTHPKRWLLQRRDGAEQPVGPGEAPFALGPNTGLEVLRYRHILGEVGRPELITDFLGYNTYQLSRARNWVGDLMLECEVAVESAQGRLFLDLARGADRFQARFDLAAETCVLVRMPAKGPEEELGRQRVSLKSGRTRLRFANFDQRLTLWVDDALPFGEGVPYKPPKRRGPTESDLWPASVGAENGQVRVAHLKLWRDTYYTLSTAQADADPVDLSDERAWVPLRSLPVKTFYVQPGHYFFLGDNSPESSDSRMWGLVPERLLLGRVFLIYYPFARAGLIR